MQATLVARKLWSNRYPNYLIIRQWMAIFPVQVRIDLFLSPWFVYQKPAYSYKDLRKMSVFSGPKVSSSKHVLIMDEVDGMAGNEDRGGMQELINLIKSTKVPIICMCNDRNSQKVRSLANYCFDLRFQRPRVDQIKV